jgi:acyl-CoA reductase-like NAD-dependent aldehyde dehydrogenase
VVAVTSYERPVPAITLGEVMATSDVPGGVVNLLTGSASEIGPWLAEHMDVNGIDLTGIADADEARDLEAAAAENLKRVRRPADEDWSADPGTGRMTQFLETKTVWHPIGV